MLPLVLFGERRTGALKRPRAILSEPNPMIKRLQDLLRTLKPEGPQEAKASLWNVVEKQLVRPTKCTGLAFVKLLPPKVCRRRQHILI